MDDYLQIDPPAACARIEEFLQRKMAELHKQGLIFGLSGGLDSAITAYLSARAVGPEKVRLLYLPERDSKPLHGRHAQLVADHLGISLQVRNMTPLLEQTGIYELLPTSRIPGRPLRALVAKLGRRLLGFGPESSVLKARLQARPGSYVARGNAYGMAKHRLRMILIYQQAEMQGLMVAGAANRTEWMTGTFSLWGVDHCADIMPIIHLYRSQLLPLATYLGVPGEILDTSADPDMVPGVDDKGALLGTFAEADRILAGLEHGLSREELIQSSPARAVDHILSLVELSRPMRESPYSLLPAAIQR
jgi:NAD+ synthase